MQINVLTQNFEGPLDVLLHLIEKNEMDIYDIEINKIAEQYMVFILESLDLNLDDASEFVVMASTLMEIKSKQLLPEAFLPEDIEALDPDDPRKELVEKLLEYKKYKQLSTHLKYRNDHFGNMHYRDQEDLIKTLEIDFKDDSVQFDASLIVEAMQRMLAQMPQKNQQPQRFFKGLKRDLFTVETKMDRIRQMITFEKKSLSAFVETEYVREELIVIFLALLEMLKMKEILVHQDVLYGNVTIEKRGAESGRVSEGVN